MALSVLKGKSFRTYSFAKEAKKNSQTQQTTVCLRVNQQRYARLPFFIFLTGIKFQQKYS